MFKLALQTFSRAAITRAALVYKPVIRAPIPYRYYSISTEGKPIPQEIESLTLNKYHKISGDYLESVFVHLEKLSEEIEDIEIDYDDGILNLEIPAGLYVINKQPPNKQIWLSSPISGPNRFDLVDSEWVSLRDGTKLTETLEKEIGGNIGQAIGGDQFKLNVKN